MNWSRAAANIGFTIAGIPCFAATFSVDQRVVLRRKFSANKTAIGNHRNVGSKILRKYVQIYRRFRD